MVVHLLSEGIFEFYRTQEGQKQKALMCLSLQVDLNVGVSSAAFLLLALREKSSNWNQWNVNFFLV